MTWLDSVLLIISHLIDTILECRFMSMPNWHISLFSTLSRLGRRPITTNATTQNLRHQLTTSGYRTAITNSDSVTLQRHLNLSHLSFSFIRIALERSLSLSD